MKNLFKFLKTNRLPILVLLVSFVLFIAFTTYSKDKVKDNSQTTSVGVEYKGLIAGQSNLNDVEEKLGKSLNKEELNGKEILEYQSSSSNRNHELIASNNTVEFIKEIITSKDNIKSNNLISKYGTSSRKLYNHSKTSSFALYVYLSTGVAYLGHGDGTVIEVWYFPPTDSLDDFIKMWAQDYSLIKPSPEFFDPDKFGPVE